MSEVDDVRSHSLVLFPVRNIVYSFSIPGSIGFFVCSKVCFALFFFKRFCFVLRLELTCESANVFVGTPWSVLYLCVT